MGKVIEIRGKTEQRIQQIMSLLQNADAPLSYQDLQIATGAKKHSGGRSTIGGVPYDVLLFVLSTLVEVGLVERSEKIEGPGRPRVYFTWKHPAKGARAGGARMSA